MSLGPRSMPVLAALLVLPALASASVVTFMDGETLVHLSPVIVRGTVTSVTFVEAGVDRGIFTEVTLQVTEALRGPARAGSVRFRLLGGRVGAREARVYGTPDFVPGEDVVLFARPAKAGFLTVTGLFQGKVTIERRHGVAFAVPAVLPDRDRDRVLVLPRGASREGPVPLEPYLSRLRGLVATVPPIDDFEPGALERPEPPAAAVDPAGPSFTLLLVPFRRFEPDSGIPIAYRYNPTNAPSVPDAGGPRGAFVEALSAWNAVSGHALRMLDGGDTAAQCFLTFDGISGVSHDDPCGEVPAFDPSTCSGVLAIGGFSEINPFQVKTVNGQTFFRGLQGDVVLNSDAGCFWSEARNYEEVLSHELGHTIGLGHSCGDSNSPSCATSPLLDEAQMRAFAHGDGRGADPRRDDVKGIRFIYPPAAFVELLSNGTTFQTGDNVRLTMDLNGTRRADLWFFTSFPGSGVTGGRAAASLALSFLSDVTLLDYTFVGGEAPGTYIVVAALTVPGGSPSVGSNILSFSVAQFQFAP